MCQDYPLRPRTTPRPSARDLGRYAWAALALIFAIRSRRLLACLLPPVSCWPASVASSDSNGSGAAPFGASASSIALVSASSFRLAAFTFGYRGSISIRVRASTAVTQARANHLWSAGITYHGAQSVDVFDSISENAV